MTIEPQAQKKFFSKRIIFDHLPKTAGTSISTWLRGQLGSGSISDSFLCHHQEAIRKYGGLFPVIFGHLEFNGEGLDPRYHYVTLLREPVDRVLSWLFFILRNHERYQTPEIYDWCQAFMNSEGEEVINRRHLSNIANFYTTHFSKISNLLVDSDPRPAWDTAFSAIMQFDVVGLYEELPRFLVDFAEILELPAPKEIDRMNVTKSRLSSMEISKALRKRIADLNTTDIVFYEKMREQQSEIRAKTVKSFVVSGWRKYERRHAHAFTSNDIPQVRASVRGESSVLPGQYVTFDVDFLATRGIRRLAAGVHIFDSNENLVFGTNNNLQNRELCIPSAGSYRIRHIIKADLSPGSYSAGFAFSEIFDDEERLRLAWFDKFCDFSVKSYSNEQHVGYSSLIAAIMLERTFLADDRRLVSSAKGSLNILKLPEKWYAGETYSCDVEIVNNTPLLWLGDAFRPINLSYHWRDCFGNIAVFDGLRTRLPLAGVPPNCSIKSEILVKAPQQEGTYALEISLVQELVIWLDEKGLIPGRCTVDVFAR